MLELEPRCSRCGQRLEGVAEEVAWQLTRAGHAVTHDVCPVETRPTYDYHVTVTIDRKPHVGASGDPDEGAVETVRLTSVGDVIEARSFPEMLTRLPDVLAPQWDKVRELAHVVEEDL